MVRRYAFPRVFLWILSSYQHSLSSIENPASGAEFELTRVGSAGEKQSMVGFPLVGILGVLLASLQTSSEIGIFQKPPKGSTRSCEKRCADALVGELPHGRGRSRRGQHALTLHKIGHRTV